MEGQFYRSLGQHYTFNQLYGDPNQNLNHYGPLTNFFGTYSFQRALTFKGFVDLQGDQGDWHDIAILKTVNALQQLNLPPLQPVPGVPMQYGMVVAWNGLAAER